jgi:hypothetical protein
MRLLQIFSIWFLSLIFSLGVAQAAEQTFAKPKENGVRVDWCLNWGSQCGRPAADRFCQAKGFPQSNDFVEDVDVGSTGISTLVTGTNQICRGGYCDAFTYITCAGPDAPPPPPRSDPPVRPEPPVRPTPTDADTETFEKPILRNARLNYCYRKGRGCGQRAADAFCESQDFDGASDFRQSSPLSPLVRTRFIGSRRICTDLVCFAFASITCENEP